MRHLFACCLLFLAFLGLSSCEDPKNISLNLADNAGQLATSFTDSVSVNVSTMLIDSAITSNQYTVLAGGYRDPVLGYVDTKSFFQVNLPSSSLYTGYYDNFDVKALAIATNAADDVVYDSVGVYLGFNGFTYGKDTLQNLTLELHALLEPVNPSPVAYISSNSVKYDSKVLASKTFTIRDLKTVSGDTTKKLQFTLPNSFGQQLYAMSGQIPISIPYTDASGNSSIVSVGDNDKFHAFLQGFALVAKRGPNIVYSFNLASTSGTYMYLAYHRVRGGYVLDINDGQITDSTLLSTSAARYLQQFYFSGGRFTQVNTNRQGTPLANVTQPLVAVPASQTGGKTYLQSGAGITTKVQINQTSLRNLLKLGNVTINKAELVLNTPIDSLNNIYPPRLLGMVEIDQSNRMVRPYSTGITYLPSESSPSLGQVGYYDAVNKLYRFNVTSYIQDILANRRKSDGLMLAGVSQVSGYVAGLNYINVTRAIFDNKSIKLNIYYSASKTQ